MAEKNIQIKVPNGSDWDHLYPVTKQSNVFNRDGISLERINGLTNDYVSIYVDSVEGDDLTGDGSILKPYKTLSHVAKIFPKIIEKDHTIYVNGVFDEDVAFKGISGAAIIIEPRDGIKDPTTGTTGFFLRSITFYDCNCICIVNNAEQINSENIPGSAFIRFSRVKYGRASGVRALNTNITKNTIEFDGSSGSVNQCYFNGQNYCVVSKNGSNVRVDSSNKHGDTPSSTGLWANAGQIFEAGSNDWIKKTNNWKAQSNGGQFNYGIQILELSDMLENGWQPYDTGTNRPMAIKHNSVVYLQGLIKDGEVGQGVIAFTLPPLWTPQFVDRYYNPFGSDGQITKIRIGRSGVVSVEVATGQYVSLSDIPPFYVGE